MAKRKVISLGGKKFFSMVVLSSLALGLMFTTFALQQPTNTESEASGDSTANIINCNSKNGRSGGIQIYNEPNLKGGSRVMCVRMQTKLFKSQQSDKNLGTIQSGTKYYDIWNFNNKMESFVLRANRFCTIQAFIYGKTGYGNLLYKTPIIGGMSVDHVISKEFKWLPKEARDKASSITLKTACDLSKYGYTDYK